MSMAVYRPRQNEITSALRLVTGFQRCGNERFRRFCQCSSSFQTSPGSLKTATPEEVAHIMWVGYERRRNLVENVGVQSA